MTRNKATAKSRRRSKPARAVRMTAVPCITTTSGISMPPDGDADLFRLVDIATGLAKLCRYAGQCDGFYSVAEHSAVMARHLLRTTGNADVARTALLHDAVEAYWGDIPSPYKAVLPGFEQIENVWLAKVIERYGGIFPLPAPVKQADLRIRIDEVEALFPEDNKILSGMDPDVKPLGIRIRALGWRSAQRLFLDTADQLGIHD